MAHVPNEKTCLWAVPSCQLLPVSRRAQLQFWFTSLSVCVPWTFFNLFRLCRHICQVLTHWEFTAFIALTDSYSDEIVDLNSFFPAIICISFVGHLSGLFDSPVPSSHLLPPPVAHRCLALACPSRWRWRRTTVVAVMSWPFADTSWTGTSSRFTLSTLPATTLWVIWRTCRGAGVLYFRDRTDDGFLWTKKFIQVYFPKIKLIST